MGGKNSIQGRIQIHPYRIDFYPGEQVKDQPLNPPTILNLHFSGSQKVGFKRCLSNLNQGKVLAEISGQLTRWEKTLNPGIYTVPFALILPFQLRSSFKFINRNYYGQIHYQLNTILISPTGKRLQNSISLLLKDKQSTHLPGCRQMKQDIALMKKFWRNQGNSRLRVDISHSVFTLDNLPGITVEVDNSQCKSPINFVQCRLLRRVRLKCGKHEVKKQQIIAQIRSQMIAAYSEIEVMGVAFDLDHVKENIRGMFHIQSSMIKCCYCVEVVSRVVGFYGHQLPKVVIPVVILPQYNVEYQSQADAPTKRIGDPFSTYY